MSRGVFVLGGGAVGRSLGAALAAAGQRIVGVHCRTEASALKAAAATGGAPSAGALPATLGQAATVLVCVPDPVLGAVAEQALTAGCCTDRQVWLHTAGALGAAALASIAGTVRGTGAFHPALVFPPGRTTALPPGACFAVDGDREALVEARRLAGLLGGAAVEVPASARPAYHAATVLASNCLVSLIAEARTVLEAVDLPADAVEPLLVTLAGSATAAIAAIGIGPSLSGPVRRGDTAAIERHLAALADRPALAELYRVTGRATLRLARDLPDFPAQKRRALAALLGDNEEDD